MKYRIYWDTGFGTIFEVIEAGNHDEAMNAAYEAAREDFESQADYGAHELDGSEEDEG